MPDKRDNLRHQLSHRSGPAAKWLSFLLLAIFLMPQKKRRSFGRPIKNKCVESISDIPKNVAKALLGIKYSHPYTPTTTKKSKA